MRYGDGVEYPDTDNSNVYYMKLDKEGNIIVEDKKITTGLDARRQTFLRYQ